MANKIEENTVSAQAQTANPVKITKNGGKIRVLFIGNSITRHAPKAELSWYNDCGMAASSEEKDYVHVTIKLLEERYGAIDYAVANCAAWERAYYDDTLLQNWSAARDFNADIVVIRLGENLWSARDKFDEQPIEKHFANMVEYFSPNPFAKVVVSGLFWAQPTIEKALYGVAKNKGYALVALDDLGENEENTATKKFPHAGVAMHPGDLGMERIARRIAKTILQ